VLCWTLQALTLGRGSRHLSSPKHLDWLWNTSSLLFNECQRLLRYEYSRHGMKPSTHLHQAPPLWLSTVIPLLCVHALLARTKQTSTQIHLISCSYFKHTSFDNVDRSLQASLHCAVFNPSHVLSSVDCTMYPSVLGRRCYLNPSVIAGIVTAVFINKYFVKKVFVFCPT
jgi:hypothetical protein